MTKGLTPRTAATLDLLKGLIPKSMTVATLLTKQTVVADKMCVVTVASAQDLASGLIPLPYGFRFPDGKVIWNDASAGRGKLIRIQRTEVGDGKVVTRYVAADTLFEVVSDFDQIVFVQPPA